MRIRHLVLAVLGFSALLASASLALYYRSQAIHYRREWAAVLAHLGKPSEGTELLSPAPPSASPHPSPAPTQPGAATGIRPTPAPLASTVTGVEPSEAASSDDDGAEQTGPMPPKRREEVAAHQTASAAQRQQNQQQAQAAWNQATNYFASRNTAGMSNAELAEYNGMVALLNETWALKQLPQDSLRPDERRAAAYAIQSNMVALTTMLENERSREYRDLAAAMGRNGTEASAFAGYINQINSNTSINAIFPETVQRGPGNRGGRGMPMFRGR